MNFDYIKSFGEYLLNGRNCSKSTAEAYLRDIKYFIKFAEENSSVPEVEKIASAFVNAYVSDIKRSGKSYATVLRTVASLRCFFRFLVKIKAIEKAPRIEIPDSRAETEKFPEILSEDEVKRLLSQPDCGNMKGMRDKAMLDLMYATGIRVSELLSVGVNDIDFQLGVLRLRSKTRERIIPVYRDAIKSVKTYTKKVRSAIVCDDSVTVLFTGMSGRPLTRQGLWKIIKHYADMAGIRHDITPHTLRHSFATHLIENGAPVEDVKELLGHSDISSTRMYKRMVQSRYSQSYNKYHPLAK